MFTGYKDNGHDTGLKCKFLYNFLISSNISLTAYLDTFHWTIFMGESFQDYN